MLTNTPIYKAVPDVTQQRLAELQNLNLLGAARRQVVADYPDWVVAEQSLEEVEGIHPEIAMQLREGPKNVPDLVRLVEHGGFTWVLRKDLPGAR